LAEHIERYQPACEIEREEVEDIAFWAGASSARAPSTQPYGRSAWSSKKKRSPIPTPPRPNPRA
jgi:hypothetical protein